MRYFLITSSTDGIGRAIAEKVLYSLSDAYVICNYGSHDEKAQKFITDNLAFQDRLTVLKADLSYYEGLQKFVNAVHSQFDHIDYLVCNTGISAYGSFDDYDWDLWNRVLTTNLSIPAFLIKDLKYTISENGSILLMGSDAGIKSYSSSVIYSVSKAGLIHLGKVLVKELEPRGIRINALAPGFIETNWQAARTEESYARINRKIALHRFGMPEEVADLAFSVLMNGYVNGSVFTINGGYEYF